MALTLTKGVDEINANLKKAIKISLDGTFAGLVEAAIFIQGEAQDITPHKTGILVGGSFTDHDRDQMAGRIGYTADYAAFVHEMPDPTASGKPVNWSKEGTGNKFLEKAIVNNIQAILDKIWQRAKMQ